ncbi:hypothetical protein Clacol_005719 [Clathrus columnatus]|uniref:Uncharacterized protein n=1 Tax=Clathrus columnatus TaxID=1419009 RepID=A0AAV5AET1_9AGAM|nr:hypothetical protein Clacol_005719 [Clathrus columnatus]
MDRRFERLLLALSTHALYTQIRSPSLRNLIKSPKNIQDVLREQPSIYASVVAQAQEKQEGLLREISDLNLRTQAFVSFRNRLQATNYPTDLSELDIEQLSTLQNSAYKDVLRVWKYKDSLQAEESVGSKECSTAPEDSLEWFLALSSSFPVNIPDILSKGIDATGPSQQNPSNASSIYPTLPTAAANHPAMLKKLTSFPHVMSTEEVSESQQNFQMGSDQTFENLPMIQKMLNDASHDQEILQELLDATTQEKRRLEAKLKRVKKDIQPVPGSTQEVNFWMPPEPLEDSKSTQVDASTLEYLRQAGITGKQETEETIQQRFEQSVFALRESLNPSKTSIIDSRPSATRQEIEAPSEVFEDYDQNYTTPRPSKLPIRMTEVMDTVRQVPITPRRSTLLPNMLATFSRKGYSQDLLADISLPDVSTPSARGHNSDDSNKDDVPFEGHSIVLRDMLLNADGYDEGSCNLLDNAILEESDDFAEL